MKNLLLITILFAQGCLLYAGPPPDTLINQRNKKTATIEYGTASFYHNKFQDRLTASGETFDQEKLTAAHNSLPLHTWIRVTNMRNMKVVIVRINDRLHKNNPRLVDLSRSAASKLGYIGRGLTWVKVEVLGKKPPFNHLSKK
ncbi:MAG TPA: septal ring lytic transglycosylase RlpA family protein [Flavitalea sp.]|nr:septal ring lytic transglycosylase RlpA family protein [Flavitalea sp.]